MDALLLWNGIGDAEKAAIGGLLVGLLFGACAERSRFCLRSACLEFWQGRLGPSVGIWLFTFGTALALVQLLILTGELRTAGVRQLDALGTLSGAVIGGLLFGAGMVLARGCASRLLVLSATGNIRALLAGLVVTLVAQASLTGVLAPLRESLSGLWLVAPAVRDLGAWLPTGTGMAAGLAILALAVVVAWRQRIGPATALFAAGVGAAVALGWWFTARLAAVAFDPVAVTSVTFTGPSADTLMALMATSDVIPSFGLGMVPGVFAGSLAASLLGGSFEIKSFDAASGTVRYLAGAALMGFGGMLAGGCAVGAGITGGSMLSLTAWVALLAMWVGGGLADRMLALAGRTGGSDQTAALPVR